MRSEPCFTVNVSLKLGVYVYTSGVPLKGEDSACLVKDASRTCTELWELCSVWEGWGGARQAIAASGLSLFVKSTARSVEVTRENSKS